ncbi:MAG: YfhO family protein [Candidatus Parcubacteria bacterium]|nr:YfhO family protein [Candidatus Parcubacteria bacterium]
MKFLKKISLSYILLFILTIGLLFTYRQVIFNGKILFPSNFLAQVYSPWKTEKFSGWETGIPHKPIGDDQIRIFYPERTFANKMLAEQTIPLWNPYNFSGTPFLANFQSAVFYPLNILYLFLPQIIAWEILLFIQPIMAFFFMYLFLNHFSLKKQALWLGAISFGLSGFMLVWSQENVVVAQSALWLPLVLYGIEGYLKEKKFRYYCVAIIALACSLFGGFFQIAFYIFLFSFLYSLYRVLHLKLPFYNSMSRVIGIYIFSLGLSAMQLLPSIEAFFESPRSTSSAWYLFERYLLPVTHLFNVFVPDIFGNPGAYNFFGRGFYRETILYAGLIPFVFFVYMIFKRKANSLISFFIFSAVVSFFLTIDSPFTRWLFQLPIPLLPTFLPSRILFLTSFSIAALSAFGLSTFIEQREKKELKLMLCILSFFYISLSLIAFYGFLLFKFGNTPLFQKLNDYIIIGGSSPTKMNIFVLLKNLVLPFILLSLLLVLVRIKRRFNLALLGIIILTLFGQFYFLNKYLVIGDSQFLYPENPVLSFLQSRNSLNRFLTLREPMEENISTYANIYSAEGTNPVFPRRYGELLSTLKNNGKLTGDIPRVEARLSEMGDKENPFEDNRRMRLFSLLGIKHVLYFDNLNSENSNANEFPKDLFKPVWQNDNWYGLEYTKAFPRVFLANNINIQNNPQKILNLIFNPEINLLNTVILEEIPKEMTNSDNSIQLSKPSSDSTVSIISYKPQEIVIHAKTNTPQMLFLSDNYYPGWKAYVDNKETKIYRTDYTFRSIYLPKGNHTVVFTYKPLSFQIGLIITLGSLSLLLVVIFYPIYASCLIFKNFRNKFHFFKR